MVCVVILVKVKSLIINKAFCIVQRATAQSKTGLARGYDVAEARPVFKSSIKVRRCLLLLPALPSLHLCH
jgi:hypothetical protein